MKFETFTRILFAADFPFLWNVFRTKALLLEFFICWIWFFCLSDFGFLEGIFLLINYVFLLVNDRSHFYRRPLLLVYSVAIVGLMYFLLLVAFELNWNVVWLWSFKSKTISSWYLWFSITHCALLFKVKRQESQLRQFSNVAARSCRTSRFSGGAGMHHFVHEFYSTNWKHWDLFKYIATFFFITYWPLRTYAANRLIIICNLILTVVY